MVVRTALAILALSGTAMAVDDAAAQSSLDLNGVVIDVETRAGIPDVILHVLGTDVSAATDDEGNFIIRGVPPGVWTLYVDHLAYGTFEHSITVAEDVQLTLEVRLAPQAIELDALVVEGESTLERRQRTTGAGIWEVTREEIERALGTSRHVGDLIRQTVPGIRMRQSNQFAGQDVCLEFRAAATISIVNARACAHPMVLVDGVQVADPNFLYGSIGLSNLHRIEVIPPGSAGARYGTGSLYGVILIETARPGLVGSDRDGSISSFPGRERLTFDWEQDPAGHSTGRAVVGAVVGNALGLALGRTLARECISIQAEQIQTECAGGLNFAAGAAAFAMPALGSAWGVRLGGGTDSSIGRIIPAVVGAGMMRLPGYAFSMSTAGGDVQLVNNIGHAFLVLGVPLAVTVADRLFRKLR